MWRKLLIPRATTAAAASFFALPSALIYADDDTPSNGMSLARRNSMRIQKKYYPYVIVGGGTTAQGALEAIRQAEPNADVLLLSQETSIPRLDANWGTSSSSSEEEQVIDEGLLETFNEWRRHVTPHLANEPDAYSSSPVTLLLGKNDLHLDVDGKRILLADGTSISYDKCLLATAGTPRSFYVLDSSRMRWSVARDRVNTVSSLADFQALDTMLLKQQSPPEISNVTVVGGGFLGTEIAARLASSSSSLSVQQVFVESAPLSRYLPAYLATHLKSKLSQIGVELMSDRLVTAIKTSGDEEKNNLTLSLMGDEKSKLVTDYVALCSTHIDPNVKFAKDNILEIDSSNAGIVVNSQLEAAAGVYVAGNLASYYDATLDRRVRVELYDHAVNSGLLAGRNMVASKVGKAKSYRHLPMMRSNIAGVDVLIEGVGEIDSNLRTVSVWLDKNGGSGTMMERGIVYYVKGNSIVGIVLWNSSDLLENARQVLAQQPVIKTPEVDLKSVISLGPDNWLKVIAE